jgi:hypothetical protein
MTKLRSLFAVAASSLVLASCGSTATDSSVSLTNYQGEGFSMDVPKSWTPVEKFAVPTPKNGTVALALTSSDISSGFANNLLVLKDGVAAAENGEKMTSKRYSIVNQALTTGAYKEYVKLDEKTVSFSDGDESNLYVFEAKYNDSTPKKRFVQTAKICGDKVYLVTVGIELGTASSAKYEDLTKSFVCTK